MVSTSVAYGCGENGILDTSAEPASADCKRSQTMLRKHLVSVGEERGNAASVHEYHALILTKGAVTN